MKNPFKNLDLLGFKAEAETREIKRQQFLFLQKEQEEILEKAVSENRQLTETEQIKLDIIGLKISDLYR